MNSKAIDSKLRLLALTVSWLVLVQVLDASGATRYVNVSNVTPSPPYTNWATAANVIQDAVDVALAGDEVLVTNGVYQTGGRAVNGVLTNRVAVTKPLTIRSVNGPVATVIQGHQVPGTTNGDSAVRCIYLTNGVALHGFRLTNGGTRKVEDYYDSVGGGIFCETYSVIVSNCVVTGNAAHIAAGGIAGGTIYNCTISGNRAWPGGSDGSTGGGTFESDLNNCILFDNYAHWGGGTFGRTLNNCLLTGNTAWIGGGGAYQATLNNCTLTGNSAIGHGGGVFYASFLSNCIVYYNTAPTGENHLESALNYSCTTPLPASGIGNITNAPLFVNQAGGNFHLQAGSPCINAGNNATAPAGLDLDGNPRIFNGTVDVGAYEFVPPPPPPPAAPFAHTSDLTEVRTNSARLNGFATANGLESVAWFEWGVRASYTNAISPVAVGNGLNVVRVITAITNLLRGRDYQCRLVVSNVLGVTRGAARQFVCGGRVRVWAGGSSGETNVPPNLAGVVSISAGDFHNLALRTDGTVTAWGSVGLGTTNVPLGLTNVVAVEACGSANLALKSNGAIATWGSPIYGQTNLPPGLSNIVAIAGGGTHCLALRSDGTVVAWGDNSSGQTNVPVGLKNVVALDGGGYHSMALRADGTVVVWGGNYTGQTNVPPGLSNIIQISAGAAHSLALTATGVVAWGDNQYGQVTLPSGLSNVTTITASAYHNLVLKQDRTVMAWGHNNYGETNVPPDLTNALALASTASHNLALVLPDNSPPQAQAQSVSGATNANLLITLPTSDADDDPVTIRITSLPEAGALFQYEDGALGTPITTNGTPVADSSGRVIFVPALGSTGNPYTSFSFVANDGLVDSPAAAVTIRVDVPTAPFAFTRAATQITTNSATLNGMATPNLLPTTTWFEWGMNTAHGQVTLPQPVGSGQFVVATSVTLTNLDRGSQYHFRLVSSNALGLVTGADQTILTGGRIKAWGYNNSGQTNVPAAITNAVAIAAGGFHSLALLPNGVVAGWGSNSDGQRNPPASLSNVVGIAAGGYHSLALRGDSTVTGWGWNNDGQVSTPVGLSNVIAVAAAVVRSMVLRADGTLVAWGYNSEGQSNVPTNLNNVVSIAIGASHNVALKADGTTACWGFGLLGQLDMPVGLTNIVGVAAGNYHSLALRRDGTVVGWGDNSEGQATPPSGLTNIISIHAQASHSYAIRSDGTVVAWGNDSFGEISIAQTMSNVVALAAGYNHALALLPDTAPAAQPQNVSVTPNTDTVLQLTASDADNDPLAFIIKSLPALGYLYQYSSGVRGTIITNSDTYVTDSIGRVIYAPAAGGIGNPYASFTYIASDGELETAPATVTISIIGPLNVFTRPATDISPTTAKINGFVAPNGFATTAWLEWGTNSSYGQSTSFLDAGSGKGVVYLMQKLAGLAAGQAIHFRLVASNASQVVYGADQPFITGGKVRAWGDNSSGQSAAPTNLGAVVSVAGGLSHTLALRPGGTVAVLGNNLQGQTNVPPGLAGVAAVAAGGFHNLALRTNGSVVAWGRNNLGQTNVPANASNVVAITAGGQHSVALRADGSLVAWGDNSQGQRIISASLTNIVGIAAGWYYNVALRSDGTVTAWGANTYGQTNTPSGLTNVVWVGAGLYHSLALRSDGTMIAWGLNSSGQTNIPSSATNTIAIAGGGSHNLAMQTNGALAGWGYNFFGQATPPASLSNVVNLAAGGSHSLALVANHLPVALDQTVAGYPNTDLLVTLTSSDADNDALSYRVIAVPTAGALYQVASGLRGAQIINPDTSVSDSLGRLIFAPVANQIGSPHAMFGFTASDSFALSTPATVTVNIVLPIAPTLDATASTVTTNQAFQLAFTGAINATYRVWASTNLLSWELLGPATSPSPGQFLFLDASSTNRPQRFYRATAP